MTISPHLLRENKLHSYPEFYIAVDSESFMADGVINNIQKFRLASIAFKDRKGFHIESFKSKRDMWVRIYELAASYKETWLFAHNWNYDLVNLAGYVHLRDMGFNLEKSILDEHKFMQFWKKDSVRLNLVDTMNYFVAFSVDKLAPYMNETKVHFAKDEATPTIWNALTNSEIKERCETDVRIIWKAMHELINFWKENEYGDFGFTLAKLSFNAFRHKYMKHKIYIHGDAKGHYALTNALEIRASRGAIVQPFYIGDYSNLIMLDFNSLYPAMMRSKKVPTRLLRYYEANKENMLYLKDARKKGLLVIAECKFWIPKGMEMIAVKYTDGLKLPNGHLVEVLCTPEVDFLLENGLLLEVGRMAIYEGDIVFTEYVDEMNKGKVQNIKKNKLWAQIFKLLMNSLYGRFGMRTPKEERFTDADDLMQWGCSVGDEKSQFAKIKWMNGMAFKYSGEEAIGQDSFPAISAHILAYARMELLKLKRIADENYEGNVVYSDTDSLMVRDPTPLAFYIHPDKIGYLKPEKTGRFIIKAPKDYELVDGTDLTTNEAIHNLVKKKGIPKSAKILPDGGYEYNHIMRLRECIWKGINPNEIWVERRTRYSNPDLSKKGILQSNGYLQPLTINDSSWFEIKGEANHCEFWQFVRTNEVKPEKIIQVAAE